MKVAEENPMKRDEYQRWETGKKTCRQGFVILLFYERFYSQPNRDFQTEGKLVARLLESAEWWVLETGEAAWIPGELGGNVGQMGQELEKKFSDMELPK